jgi:hypothetical protein
LGTPALDYCLYNLLREGRKINSTTSKVVIFHNIDKLWKPNLTWPNLNQSNLT